MLWVHAGLALAGLWAFYTLMYWGCASALPQAETPADDIARAVFAATASLATIVLSGAITPWLLDRLLRVTWIELDQAGDVGPHLRAVLDQRRLPSPHLGVVADADPCALTYGFTRRSARLVVTKGLLESLNVDEQCAIATHEAAHLVSGDFLVATVFAGPMLILTRLRRLFEQGPPAGAHAGFTTGPTANGGFLTPLLVALLRVYALLYAGFAQYRERWADQFTRRRLDGRALEDGLLRMLVRLAMPSPTNHALATAARGFTPIDAAYAGRLATAAAWDGHLDPHRLAELSRVVEANPASRWTQQFALHPPPGARIPSGVDDAGRVSAFTLMRLLGASLPAAGLLCGLVASIALGGWFGLPLMLWGVGRLIWLALEHGRTRGHVANEAALRDVLEKFAAEPARAFRAELTGTVAGRGVPGVTWCPDVVLQCAGMYIAARPRVILGALRAEDASRAVASHEGRPCVARGVLRMMDVPYLELHGLDADHQAIWRSHFVATHVLGSVLLLVLGAILCAPQWMGF